MNNQNTRTNIDDFEAIRKSIDAGLSKVCKDKAITLLFGQTGAGKTTFALATQGERLSVKENGGEYIYEPSDKSDLVSNGVESKSEVPAIYNNKMDLPGLGDTRGPIHQISAAYSIYSAVKAFSNIKIAIVITESMLFNTRLIEFRDTMNSFNETFEWNSNKLEGVFLLVTKAEKPEKNLRSKIAFLYKNSNLQGLERQVLGGVVDASIPLLIFRAPNSEDDEWSDSVGTALNNQIDQIHCTNECKAKIAHSDETIVLLQNIKEKIRLEFF